MTNRELLIGLIRAHDLEMDELAQIRLITREPEGGTVIREKLVTPVMVNMKGQIALEAWDVQNAPEREIR